MKETIGKENGSLNFIYASLVHTVLFVIGVYIISGKFFLHLDVLLESELIKGNPQKEIIELIDKMDNIIIKIERSTEKSKIFPLLEEAKKISDQLNQKIKNSKLSEDETKKWTKRYQEMLNKIIQRNQP